MKPDSKAILLVCALAVLAHLPGLFAGFALDDEMLLTQNPYLRQWAELGRVLTSEFFLASGAPRNVPYYRPLSGALYFFSYQLLGDRAVLQHGLNLLLHAGVVALFYSLLRRASVGRRAASLCAALFAVHPATPDIVVYVGGRQDMLGWSITLGGALLLDRARTRPVRLATIAGLTTALAALSREFFLIAPPLLAVLLLGPSKAQPDRTRPDRTRPALLTFAFGILGAIAVLLLRQALAIQAFSLERVTLLGVVQASAGIALRLLQVILVPIDVAVDVTPPALGGLASGLVLACLLLAAGGSLVAIQRRGGRLHLALFGWGWFFATVLLHVPVLLKYDAMSDRYAYGATLGLVSVLGAAARPLHASLRSVLRPALLGPVAAAVVLALLPLTWTRASEWRDELSLQLSMYRNRPDDPESRLAEGMRLFFAGDLDGAFPHCLAYSHAKPRSDRAGLCVGTVLLLRGNAQAAVKQLEPFAYGRPGEIDARVRLFQAWFAANDLDGVRRGIDYFGRMWPRAADVVAAREELSARGEPLRPAPGR